MQKPFLWPYRIVKLCTREISFNTCMLDEKLSFLRALWLNNMSVASSCQFCRISFYPVNHRATGGFAFFILLKKNEEPVNLLKSMKLSWKHKVSICFVNQNLKQITQIILQTNITKFQIHFVFLCIKGAQYIKLQTLPHSELFCLFISASQVDPPGQEFHRGFF